MGNIDKQGLPPIYRRNGKECYLDPIRKRLTYVTPEEQVRQKVVTYLINSLGVPNDMILVEEHLSHYGIETSLRADIVIHKKNDETDEMNPIAIIECKAKGVMLGEREMEQVVGYTDAVGAEYAVLTDGEKIFCYKYEIDSEKYIQADALPSYLEMIKGEYIKKEIECIPARIAFEELARKADMYIGYDIGTDTKDSLAIPMINLWECFLDTSRKLPEKRYRNFELIQDYGIRLLSYGNASGGNFEGPYRSFLVKVKNRVQIVSISLSTYSTSSRPDVSKTAINVAIDTEVSAHHSLQLTVDNNVLLNGSELLFYHSGKIAVGNQGSGKVAELMELVRNKDSTLMHEGKIFLGKLKHNRLWYLDDSEVVLFIENLISYALIRDELRVKIKKEKGVERRSKKK